MGIFGGLFDTYRGLKVDGHTELIDMYYHRALGIASGFRTAKTEEDAMRIRLGAESALHGLLRSADAICADVSVYQRNIEGLLR